jgi:hypothetical protein
LQLAGMLVRSYWFACAPTAATAGDRRYEG